MHADVAQDAENGEARGDAGERRERALGDARWIQSESRTWNLHEVTVR